MGDGVKPDTTIEELLLPVGKVGITATVAAAGGAKGLIAALRAKLTAAAEGKVEAGLGAKGIAEGAKINASELKLTKTVENHLNDLNKAGDRVRPYGDSRALMQEIMDSKLPATDPRGVPGALRWDVQGTMNGSKGTYELVVDPKANTVLHFLFKSGQ